MRYNKLTEKGGSPLVSQISKRKHCELKIPLPVTLPTNPAWSVVLVIVMCYLSSMRSWLWGAFTHPFSNPPRFVSGCPHSLRTGCPLNSGTGREAWPKAGGEEGHILETAGRVSLFPEVAIPWWESTWRGKEKPEVQPRRESSVIAPADCLNFPKPFLQGVHKPVVWRWCVFLSLYVFVSVFVLCLCLSAVCRSIHSASTVYYLFFCFGFLCA